MTEMAEHIDIDEKYPEIAKMKAVKDESQVIGNFIEAMSEQGLCLCKLEKLGHREDDYWPDRRSIEQLLADYFNIDLGKAENERRAILKEFQIQKPK